MEIIQQRKNKIQKLFSRSSTKEDMYRTIMALGKNLTPFPNRLKIEENLVHGCQSRVYISSSICEKKEKIFYTADADALISKGLVFLLISFYSGLTLEQVISLDPDFLQDMQIIESLSMNRANGLIHMILFFKKEAKKHLGAVAL